LAKKIHVFWLIVSDVMEGMALKLIWILTDCQLIKLFVTEWRISHYQNILLSIQT